MRGNDNIQESRAQTHSTLGAMACNKCVSAHKPSGKRLVAIMKKKNTLVISERLLHATVMSRLKTRHNKEGVLILRLFIPDLTANLVLNSHRSLVFDEM